jgi:hypothetical protein
MIEAFFNDRVPSQSTIEYAAMLHDVPTSALVHHLRYLIRSGELDRVEGVFHAFENRGIATSMSELSKKLRRKADSTTPAMNWPRGLPEFVG